MSSKKIKNLTRSESGESLDNYSDSGSYKSENESESENESDDESEFRIVKKRSKKPVEAIKEVKHTTEAVTIITSGQPMLCSGLCFSTKLKSGLCFSTKLKYIGFMF